MQPTSERENLASQNHLLLQVAEAQGSLKQKHCRELQTDETCTLTYTEPIKEAPVQWISEGSHVRMKPTKLWCALCPYFHHIKFTMKLL